MIWLFFALIGIWVVGSAAASTLADATILLIVLAAAVAGIQYWERRHPT